MIAAGVDPGSATGLVCVDLGETNQIALGRWQTHAVLRHGHRLGQTVAERDANLYDRLTEWFRLCHPALVVLEEPADAAVNWRGHRKQARGTAFRLGVFYGLAICAARAATPAAMLVSYPVTNHQDRPGWMQGKTRDVVFENILRLARVIAPAELLTPGDDGKVTESTEHVLMALGVLTFHLAQHGAGLPAAP